MNRRKAREFALQMLFQREYTRQGMAPPETPDDFWSDKDEAKASREFAEAVFRGTVEHMEDIDRVIKEAAANWDLKRMAAVDRNILRFAVFEILYRPDIPPAVTINESLEIAKKYSSMESVAFINGLLDKIAHDCGKA